MEITRFDCTALYRTDKTFVIHVVPVVIVVVIVVRIVAVVVMLSINRIKWQNETGKTQQPRQAARMPGHSELESLTRCKMHKILVIGIAISPLFGWLPPGQSSTISWSWLLLLLSPSSSSVRPKRIGIAEILSNAKIAGAAMRPFDENGMVISTFSSHDVPSRAPFRCHFDSTGSPRTSGQMATNNRAHGQMNWLK